MNVQSADNRDAKLVALAEQWKRTPRKGRRFVYARAMKLVNQASDAHLRDELMAEFDALLK